jgi:hypothetical protein
MPLLTMSLTLARIHLLLHNVVVEDQVAPVKVVGKRVTIGIVNEHALPVAHYCQISILGLLAFLHVDQPAKHKRAGNGLITALE